MGPFFLAFIVLLILKLTDTIDVSWFWVIFPLWVWPAFMLVLYILSTIGIFSFSAIKSIVFLWPSKPRSSKQLYCANCGSEIRKEDSFCEACGSTIKGGTQREIQAATGVYSSKKKPELVVLGIVFILVVLAIIIAVLVS